MNHRHSGLFTHPRLGMFSVLVLSTFVWFFPGRCLADSLDVTITDPSQIAMPGQTVIFSVTVTNNTGSNLTATDLGFDFFGFDPNLIIIQLLGIPDFSIPTGTTTSIMDLFSVSLGPVTGSGRFPVDFISRTSTAISARLVK
jgi:hypothetical protein